MSRTRKTQRLKSLVADLSMSNELLVLVGQERGTERLLCCASVRVHHGLLCGFGGLPIADSNVLHGRADGLVAQALPHQREVDVRRDQVASEGVLEDMGMPLLRRQPGSLGAGPEDTKELRAVEPAALLRGEQVIRAVSSPLPAPGT